MKVIKGDVIQWNIRHPGTGETIICESFDEAMDKWFEGFNIPFKITNGKCEMFEDANKRVEEYYKRQK
jgi:hypothetical protein